MQWNPITQLSIVLIPCLTQSCLVLVSHHLREFIGGDCGKYCLDRQANAQDLTQKSEEKCIVMYLDRQVNAMVVGKSIYGTYLGGGVSTGSLIFIFTPPCTK